MKRTSKLPAVANHSGIPGETGLRIDVVAAVGYGRTSLSAFDAALHTVGTHDYNLVVLSSVIPTASVVLDAGRYDARAEECGFKLFVVQAETRSDEPGSVVVSGLGWLQRADRSGVFVEHHAVVAGGPRAAAEREVAAQIMVSLGDLAERRGLDFTPDRARVRVVSARVAERPACALVLAIYGSEGWGVAAQRNGRARP